MDKDLEDILIETITEEDIEVNLPTDEDGEKGKSNNTKPIEKPEEEDEEDDILTKQDRRRRERLNQRERNKRKIEDQQETIKRLEEELKYTKAANQATQDRISRLENSEQQFRSSSIDQAIQAGEAELYRLQALEIEANQQLKNAQEILPIKNAIAKQQNDLFYLKNQKQTYQQSQTQRVISPTQQALVDVWINNNPWFSDSRFTRERAIAENLDNELTRAGYNNNYPEYYKELDRRLRANPELSYLYENDNTEQQQEKRRSPVGSSNTGSTDRPASSGGSRTVRLTPYQKEALISQGIMSADGKSVLDRKRLEFYVDKWSKNK